MITHVICDMGGVLVQLEWSERVSGLLGRDVPMEELHQLWVNARSTVDFESGRITFDEFAQNFIQEFDLDLTPTAVQREFVEFVQAPMPGWDEVVGQLQQQYQVALLSNTNSAHVEKLRDRYDFYAPFDQLFLSHEMGVMKPDPAIFQQVLTTLEIPAAAAVFFDDGAGNVTAAQSVGMQAYQVNSPQEVLAVMRSLHAEST